MLDRDLFVFIFITIILILIVIRIILDVIIRMAQIWQCTCEEIADATVLQNRF
jgi:hypothetical protein